MGQILSLKKHSGSSLQQTFATLALSCDFFLWAHVKDMVYVKQPKNIEELWQKIQEIMKQAVVKKRGGGATALCYQQPI